MSGIQAKEDTIPGTAQARLLEDELDPDSEVEVEAEVDIDADADVEVDADVDLDVDIEVEVHAEYIEFELGDNVVYPHHGAGQVQAKEIKEVFGERDSSPSRYCSASSSSLSSAYISSEARIFLARVYICFSPLDRPFSFSRSARLRTTSASS